MNLHDFHATDALGQMDAEIDRLTEELAAAQVDNGLNFFRGVLFMLGTNAVVAVIGWALWALFYVSH
jgi:hypothetical protein